MGDFSHLSKTGEAALVDISAKPQTKRAAVVTGSVRVSPACTARLTEAAWREIAHTARIAAIQAAKQTHLLVPLCHPIPLTAIDVGIAFQADEHEFTINVRTATTSGTGVEMEALVAASLAGATIYDMVKAVDAAATVGPFQLVEKQGGKHGHWVRPAQAPGE